jgi:hypothetical protein
MNENGSTNSFVASINRTSCEGLSENAGLVRKEPECRVLSKKDDPTVYKIFWNIEEFRGKGCLLDLSGVRVDRPQFIQARVKHQFKIVRVLN